MCTAISIKMREHYFGRNLDLEYSLNECVVVTPRHFPLKFSRSEDICEHLAFIGTAIVEEGTPLHFDGTNEKGLSIAGLRFAEACYKKEELGKDNIASFEFIPWILCQCESINEARRLLRHTNITDFSFSKKYQASPLHWIISDSKGSLTVEATENKINIYENPAGILTNSPEFPWHMFNLNNYMHLTENPPKNRLFKELELKPYSRGMGAMGLPGDLSSASRFVRAAFTKEKILKKSSETKSVGQFFHVLDSVCQQKGAVKLPDGKYEYTVYSSCCNTDSGVYYYKTYYDSSIRAIDMFRENLDSAVLCVYPMRDESDIRCIN